MTDRSKNSENGKGQQVDIPIRASDGQYLSALHPKYLHTNSTSHTWPFSAVAELIDNAYDPDVNASQLFIDVKQAKGQTLLILTDNGNGLTPSNLYKMVSFGFSEKVAVGDHLPVGQYGNGFKSGSMRLGKDALVFTKKENRWSLGFLSQTYLEKIKSSTIIVPIVTWDAKKFTLVEAESGGKKSLSQIMEHSVLTTIADIKDEFKQIEGSTGTRIVIWNLRKHSGGSKYELDFTTDAGDIRIPDDLSDTDEARYQREQRQDHIPASDYSLRAYCSILYLKPRMQIILRGKKVKTVVIAKSLCKTEVDLYKPNTPSGYAKPVKITFGFSQNKNHYGIMMYHKNRLIKPYVRVGHQLKPNSLGVGVIGVIECDFLQPTHNKQDFDQSKAFRACMQGLGRKLNEYWQEKKSNKSNNSNQQQQTEQAEVMLPDQKWAQCDNKNCLKWRILPDDTDLDALPEKWYCKDNPLPEWRSCDIPEKLEDEQVTVTPYKKEVTLRLKKEQQQKRKQTENTLKKANEMQQMMDKKEKELAEEKRKRTQNEQKAKAHEEEIKRLKQELDKTKAKQAPSNSQPSTPTAAGNTTPKPKTRSDTSKLTTPKSASKTPQSITMTIANTAIAKIPSLSSPVVVSPLAVSPSSNLKATTFSPNLAAAPNLASPTNLASPATSRPTRQSINQAIKVRLPFTTRRTQQATTPIAPKISTTPVSKPLLHIVNPKTEPGLLSNVKTSLVTTIVSPGQNSPILAQIQPKAGTTTQQLIALPPNIASNLQKSVVSANLTTGNPGSPKVYRFVVTDPKIRPTVPANAVITPSTVLTTSAIRPQSTVQIQQKPLTIPQATVSKPSVSSAGPPAIKQLPTSRDINQQLAQIGIDAIAAQAEEMLPTMALSTVPTMSNLGASEKLAPKTIQSGSSSQVIVNGGASSISSGTKLSNAPSIGNKRTVIDDDDEIQIVEPAKKVKTEVKSEEKSGETSGNAAGIVNGGERKQGRKNDVLNDRSIQELTKDVDKDLITDIGNIPDNKTRAFLVQRSQQLRDLRKSICQLLGLLVPDLNLPEPGKMPLDDNTIDVLLRDVLDANKESKNTR